MPIIIFLTAGHTGCSTGAVGTAAPCGAVIDEGCETIRLRDAVADLLVTRYGLPVMTDHDREPLGVLVDRINRTARISDICVDLHFNASSSPAAHGTEVVLSDDASDFEIEMGVRLLNSAARALGTSARCLKTERQTPRRRLAMVNLHCQSAILEVCFCSNSDDTLAYFSGFTRLAEAIAATIASMAG